MQPDQLDVLYEDNHLLVVNKPAGIPTQGALPGEDSLVQAAKQYIKLRWRKPGNVYLGVVSRLDALVTGVVVFARTSKAAARLSAQFAGEHPPHKTYWALVEHPPTPAAGTCVDWLLHDDAARRVRVVSAGTPQAREARLTYRTLRTQADATLLEVILETGRKHQIRVQLAAREVPICGDRKYGSRVPWQTGIALHARGLQFQHPVQDTRISLIAPLPAAWLRAGWTD